MNLPNIYNYLDVKYNPLIRCLFILPSSEFLEFLESINSGIGIAKENHGYEVSPDSIEFWDISNEEESSISISIEEFIDLIDPLKQDFLEEFSGHKDDVNKIILNILKKDSFLKYEFSNLEKTFLKELEWFYRNYGNEWSLDDFSNKIKNNKKKLEKILKFLSEKGIISINSKVGYSFKILKLPNIDKL
ncbi:hypothetical protein [Tenacibaculum sp. nBUS_03]|uniref:hypothetical protein n=1 Tax=Tenacibaculum sp. nBUS_03 TaxID=3395320 RepID=UPI003EBADF41